jgi:hypothetical protein
MLSRNNPVVPNLNTNLNNIAAASYINQIISMNSMSQQVK